MIFQSWGRPQGNGDKTDLCYFQKILLFQGRGRPQGNGDKTDTRLFKRLRLCADPFPLRGRSIVLEVPYSCGVHVAYQYRNSACTASPTF